MTTIATTGPTAAYLVRAARMEAAIVSLVGSRAARTAGSAAYFGAAFVSLEAGGVERAHEAAWTQYAAEQPAPARYRVV